MVHQGDKEGSFSGPTTSKIAWFKDIGKSFLLLDESPLPFFFRISFPTTLLLVCVPKRADENSLAGQKIRFAFHHS
jgi:hypothetical protein